MTEIKTEIMISAPINMVWKILIDFNSYKKWNPFIQDIQGKPSLNERLIISIKQPEKKAMIFKPRIISMTENVEFSWLGNILIPGIFDGKHNFMLKEISENQTLLIHSETFSGILRKPIFKLINKSTQSGFERMNQALKERCEDGVRNV